MHRPRTTSRTRRRGFTLVEAIAAVAILAVAMPGMLWAIREAVRKRADPIFAARARWLAAAKIEDITADANSASRGYSYIVAGNYAAETPVSGFTGMNRSVSISETGPQYVAGTGWKTITVTVGYTDGQATARTLTMSTLVTEYTP